MTKEEKYTLARWAMNYALENGASEARVTISGNTSSSIEVREEKIDKLEQANQSSLSIRLLVDNRYSSHSTNRLDNKKELGRLISEAISGTRYLSEDEFRKLPDPSLYYKGGGEDLKLYDDTYEKLDPAEKIKRVYETEKEVLGTDDRIISVTSSYFDGDGGMVMVSSNGFEGDQRSTYFALMSSVSVKGGDARPQSSWVDVSLFWENLKKSGSAKTALERALRMIGQGKIDSGKMPMIVENRSAGQLLGPVLGALTGRAIQQKNSFLINKLGEKVVSDKLTLTDDPFVKSGFSSAFFDSEGLATKKRNVFDKGVLNNYFIDTYYGRKLEMEPTSGSTTNLVFEKGDKDLDGLVKSLKRGILVTGFNGGNSNGSTGDFSFGIEGFLVEKGEIVRPVSEMNITGNMLTLWSNLVETGNDEYTQSAMRSPSLLFDGVEFSGV